MLDLKGLPEDANRIYVMPIETGCCLMHVSTNLWLKRIPGSASHWALGSMRDGSLQNEKIITPKDK